MSESVQVGLRMPRDLYDRLAAVAVAEDRSVQRQIIHTLRQKYPEVVRLQVSDCVRPA